MWKWAVFAGLVGYLILHPLVMVSGHLMMEQDIRVSLEQIVVHQIKRSFAADMLPWSIAFTFAAAALGGIYGRLRFVAEVLRASRLRYQTVVDEQLDYICRFLPDGRCTFVNDALCRLIHRSRESLLNQSIFEITEFGNLSHWRAQFTSVSADHPKSEIELALTLPDGSTRWIRWIVIAIIEDDGRIAEYQSVGHDITDIKHAQKLLESHQAELERQVERRTRALNDAVEKLQREIRERIDLQKDIRASELKYRMLFESAPMGIALTTFEGRILAANGALLAMLRMEAGILDDIDVQSLYAFQEDRNRLLEQLQKHPLVKEAEVVLRRLDGSTFFAALNLTRFTLDGQGVILAVVNDISLRKQAIEKLRRSEADLQELSARLMSVQEEERKRIARELHDSVGQLMHAIKYSLETALKQLAETDAAAGARETLARLLPVVQEASAENRRIVMDLRPSLLDDLGILATVNWFCREFGKVYGGIAIDKEIRIGESDIPSGLRIVIYRIIQEAFNNVAKHSRASRVQLTFEKSADGLILTIQDNGVGMPSEDGRSKSPLDGGFGMTSMRERARATGGVFDLFHTPGEGTGIRVIWPKEEVDRRRAS